jgi:hypothetical protein
MSEMSGIYERYNKMDAGQRRVFFFVLAIVGALAFLWMPSPLSLLPHFGGRERPVIQKPLPGRIAAPVAPVVAATTQPVPAVAPMDAQPSVDGLLGKWVARGQRVADRGLCNFSLEVKAAQPGKFTGASGLACAPLTAAQAANAGPALTMHVRNSGALDLLLDHTAPTLSTLSGVQEGNSIKLHVDETASAPAACGMTDLEVKPFQTGTVLVKWKAPACEEVSMMLLKVR